MAKCSYCDEGAMMPYRCSQCNMKYCGKHRLPEQHECRNIGNLKSPSYSRTRIAKQREMRQIKAGRSPQQGSPVTSQMAFEDSSFGNFWQPSTTFQAILLAGFLLAVVENVNETFSIMQNNLVLSLQFLTTNIVIGIVGMLVVNSFREQKAMEGGVVSKFVFWPIGIAISFITGVIGFAFYAFGFFTNNGGSLKAQAQVVKTTTYVYAGIYLTLRIFYFIFFVLFQNSIPDIYLTSLLTSGDMILWFGLIMLIPWGILDGSKLYNHDQNSYWKHLGFMILLVISSFFTVF